MKLSIVIPIYNVEKYIEKCLRSCLDQDGVEIGKDYEIICINDGTKDRSADIARTIANGTTGVRVIEQENQGLSGARNTGISNSNGEYIWFVDSDDTIEANCLCRIISRLDGSLDILQIQFRYVYEDGRIEDDAYPCYIHGVKSGREVTLSGGLPAPAQFSVLRSQFLKENKLEFVRGIYHEDSEFKPRVTYLANTIASDNIPAYNYLQRSSGSITSSFSLKRAHDIVFVNNSLLAFCKSLDDDIQRSFNDRIGLNVNSLLMGYWQLKPNERNIVEGILKRNNVFFSRMYHSNSIKYKLEGIVFGISIKLGLMLHRIIRVR